MKKYNLPRRVSIDTRANGIFHDTLKKKGPRFSIEKDRKKEASKTACRQKERF